MSKPRSKWNGELFHKWIREGRGQGVLKEYIPFIQIHDIPSLGICSRIISFTVGRLHHLLSRNELAVFYILDFDEDIIDIREQIPLLDPDDIHDLTRIVKMAEDIGIKYPRDPKSKYPYVMTTDFLVTRKDGTQKAFSIKESKAFEHKRTRELQEFERRYWKWRGIPWQIVTELEINYDRARNIQWIYSALDIDSIFPDADLRKEVMEYEVRLYENTEYSILKIAKKAERRFNLAGGFGLTAFQRLLFEKKLPFPLDEPLDLMSPRLYKNNKGGMISCLEIFQ